MSWLETHRVAFSWSFGRSSTFDECLRRYYWRYYAPYGGNAPDEAGDRARIYLLGRLSSVPMLVGSAVHRIARDALRAAQKGHPWAPTSYASGARAILHRAFRASERAARTQEVRLGRSTAILDAHYYQLPLGPEQEAEALARATGYTEALYAHPAFQAALADAQNLLAVDRLDRFRVLDVPVYSAPDVVQQVDGVYRLVDWKSGASAADYLPSHRRQLSVYALGTAAKWGVSAEQIQAMVADLHTGATHDVSFTAEELREAEGRVAASILAMQSRLRNLERNQAHAADLPMLAAPMTPLEALPRPCRRCAYRLLCYGERTLGWAG